MFNYYYIKIKCLKLFKTLVILPNIIKNVKFIFLLAKLLRFGFLSTLSSGNTFKE